MDDIRDDSGETVGSRGLARWLNWGSEYLGSGVLRLQGMLILLALAVWIFLRITGATTSLPINLLFTLCIGNWAAFLVFRLQHLFIDRAAPWKWIVFLIVIVLIGISGSILAEGLVFIVFAGRFSNFTRRVAADAPIGTLVTLIFGAVAFR